MNVKQRLGLWLTLLTLLLLPPFPFAFADDCERAVELYNQGTSSTSLAERERFFKKAIPLCSDPEVLSRVYNNLADAYEQRGRLPFAFRFYKEAMKVKPDLAIPYFGVADLFSMIGDHYSAYIMYGRGLKYEPEHAAYLDKRGMAEEGFQRRMIVYFDFDSAEIPEQYRYRLELVARAMKDLEDGAKIRVTGYTCHLGPKNYNRHLSLKRAQRVAQYLSEQFAIEPERIVATASGEDHPLLPNEDRYARSLNRRVEVEIIESEPDGPIAPPV